MWENAAMNSRNSREVMSPKAAKVLLNHLLDLKAKIEGQRKAIQVKKISDQISDELDNLERCYAGRRR